MLTDSSSHWIHYCMFLRISRATRSMVGSYQNQYLRKPVGLRGVECGGKCRIDPDEKLRNARSRRKESNGCCDGFNGSFKRGNYCWINKRRAELPCMNSFMRKHS